MTTPTSPVTLTPLLGFPEVCEGDDLADILLTSLRDNEIQLRTGDILVISSKVVSKALGLTAPAGEQAEVVLSQTVRVVAERMTPAGVTRIVESVAGPVMTAAGVDASNTADKSILLLLPHAPDAVAAQIRDGVQTGWLARSGASVLTGVILSDTAGRPWRNGQTDFALGSSGIRVVDDLRGSADTNGRVLSVTERCVADELAAAADLVKGKTDGVPVAHVRGLGQYVQDSGTSNARDLIRTGPQDWFGYGMVEAVRAALGVEPGSAVASEVGIPFITGEDATTRAGRALRVALLTCPDAMAQVGDGTISLTAPDDYALGVVASRAEVALRGEGLIPMLTRLPAQAATAFSAAALPTAELLTSQPRTSQPRTSQPRVLIAFQ
jgi:coenzyme F420-0:L-glutamate ligase / coenzyme F420-1:gamma-L-glutamate ligase